MDKKSKSRQSTESKKIYNAKAYDRLSIVVHKGERDLIRSFAEKRGLSLNGFVVGLIYREMGIVHDPDTDERKHIQDKECVICKTMFRPHGKQVTCSEECHKEYLRKLWRDYYYRRKNRKKNGKE
jgi:predicted nucleic acid-binding Zn ribbon protein